MVFFFVAVFKNKGKGFLTAATIRADCFKKCAVPVEKELRKEERGSSALKIDVNCGIVLTKWSIITGWSLLLNSPRM